MDQLNQFMEAMNSAMRPWLTALITVNYNAVLLWAVCTGHMTVAEYITNVGPANMLILGFWFGERSAMNGVKTGVATVPVVTPPDTSSPDLGQPDLAQPVATDLRDAAPLVAAKTKGKR